MNEWMNVSVIAFNSIYIKYELRSLARQRAPNPLLYLYTLNFLWKCTLPFTYVH